MRTFVMTLTLLAAMLPAAAVAQPVFEDPKALIEYAYAPYQDGGEFPEDPTELFSPTLKQLWDDMAARSEEGDAPIIDFDVFINGQDYAIRDLMIEVPALNADDATASVFFFNFGDPQHTVFALVRTGDGWKIDDIASMNPDSPWLLSELLAGDPLLN